MVLAAAWLSGCVMGPNYRRPAVQIPDSFRGTTLPASESASLADLKWWEVFKDPSLAELIRTALAQNYDLRVAVARVEAARASLGITRAGQFPNLDATGDIATNRLSRNGSMALPPSFLPSQNRTFGTATLNLLSFEVDIWGRLRRATEAARANLLGAEENRKAVVATLVSDVAAAYFSLRELDSELEIARRTLATRQDSLSLIKTRQSGGVATLLDLRQAEELVYSAAETIPVIEQQIAQTENQIGLMLGKNPGEVARGRSLTDQELPPGVPAGLPSAMLERRPDIRAAEQNLIAANARIGVAKSLYYPSISLTGSFGVMSTDLSNLFTGPARIWNWTVPVNVPIFTGGAIRGQVQSAEALQQQTLLRYQQTIQSAFREVEDALIDQQRSREALEIQTRQVESLYKYKRIASLRFDNGYTSYIEVLDAERSLFNAELAQAQTKGALFQALVNLYKATGGGWP